MGRPPCRILSALCVANAVAPTLLWLAAFARDPGHASMGFGFVFLMFLAIHLGLMVATTVVCDGPWVAFATLLLLVLPALALGR